MKTKIKFIIPIVIAVIAIIIAALCINFKPAERADITSLVSTAQKYLIESNYEQAIAEFEKAIELDPMNTDAYVGIAEAYSALGDTEKAIEWLEKGYELTGDERLKEKIDMILKESETSFSETENTNGSSEVSAESDKTTERQITYADGWYSVFKYDDNDNIISMELYNKNGELRLNAEYKYENGNVERTVYINGHLYETSDVTFTDIMADVEKAKKERANTRKEYPVSDEPNPYGGSIVWQDFNNWYVYDENGNCTEHGYHNTGKDEIGTPIMVTEQESYYKNGKVYKIHNYEYSYNDLGDEYSYDYIMYYDDKGYELYSEGGYVSGKDVTYTYEYDEYGYPVVQYENGEKNREYKNFYNCNNMGYSIWRLKNEYNDNHGIQQYNSDGTDENIELNESGLYIRKLLHASYNYGSGHTYTTYYVLSADGTKMIDVIYIKDKLLFECPYCNE